jgi:branched-chain amino acid transport system permease protein
MKFDLGVRGYTVLLIFGIAAPFIFPNYTFQLAIWMMMIMFALTWDIMGGQMGYNSLGNIFFFGAGMYVSAIVQIGLYYDVAEYTAHSGTIKIMPFTMSLEIDITFKIISQKTQTDFKRD